MSQLNIGLLGCGRIARLAHLDVLRELSGARVVALAEKNVQRRQEAGRRVPEARCFADYRDLLSASEVAAVIICLPPALHAEAAVAAFEAGKHVYLEKPIATRLDEAQAVLEAHRKAGTIGMMGFNYRFGALHREAKDYVQSGKLGKLVTVRSVFSSAHRPLPDWKRTREHGGGVLLDLASHHVDLVRFFFQEEVVDVSAQLRSQRNEHDSAALRMRLESGLFVQSFFSMCSVDEDRFEIYGQEGKLSFERHTSARIDIRPPDFAYGRMAQLKREWQTLSGSIQRVLRRSGEPSFEAALRAFVKAAQEGRSTAPDLEDGYRSLAVLEAAETAARSGSRIAVTTASRLSALSSSANIGS